MKLVLASRAKGPTNRAEAWGCVTANIALPGAGSLAAAKPIGYYQLGLATIGFVITTIAGVHLLIWMSSNWTAINQPTGDPVEALVTMWREIRLPLVGVAVFAVAWLWSAATSAQILSAHPKNPVPPRIV